MIVHSVTHPEQLINEQKATLLASTALHRCFAITYAYRQYYLPAQPELNLLAIVAVVRREGGCEIFATLTSDSSALQAELLILPDDPESLTSWAFKHQLPWLNLSAPLLLQPVHIPKPWGQEIWYTGIEARGQSAVVAQGFITPLPWLLSLMPNELASQCERQLVLLKILDPLPDEIYGDLYFEMHEQKQEVYVVTHVDQQAWPDNIGGIRLGFSQEKRAEFADDQQFKEAYLLAVKAYENIRKDIDQLFDQKRKANQMDMNDPVDAVVLKVWQQELPEKLLQEEQEKREVMDSFSAIQSLRVGDVVKVPCFTPHALQHGVRTVEFQTPVYERKILSFAQKVLTQTHWDTESALERLSLDKPQSSTLKKIQSNNHLLVEQVVEFKDFEVHRIKLAANSRYKPTQGGRYQLLMVVSGLVCYETIDSAVHTGERTYVAGQALLLPASLDTSWWVAGAEGAILLLALPLKGTQDV